MTFEMVIGLETHVELSTKTKIFCSCTTEFGGEPNTHCCPVCTGQPGSLPVLNQSVITFAAKAGLALNCHIRNHSVMARKHYVYPDLPKAYQISQFEEPLCEGGYVELDSGRKIRLTRIHIEEDAGKLVHSAGKELIDYNRGGVPLIEIVSEPDFRSAEEATEYLEKLQSILRSIGVSDCRMQEGSMRCDVNLSLRPFGQEAFGVRSETKNLNSFSSVASAIAFEYDRQEEILLAGEEVPQETRHYNDATGETSTLRSKENADDYRYFPDPDLLSVVLLDEEIETLKNQLPELPHAKYKRYVESLGIPQADARMLTKYRNVSEYFEQASQGLQQPKTAASFMVSQMFGVIQTEGEREHWAPVTSALQLGELVSLIEAGKLNHNVAKRVLGQMMDSGKGAREFLSEEDLQGFSSEDLLAICKGVLESDPKTVRDYKGGREKALKALVGGVMRNSKGRANAVLAEELLKELMMKP